MMGQMNDQTKDHFRQQKLYNFCVMTSTGNICVGQCTGDEAERLGRELHERINYHANRPWYVPRRVVMHKMLNSEIMLQCITGCFWDEYKTPYAEQALEMQRRLIERGDEGNEWKDGKGGADDE